MAAIRFDPAIKLFGTTIPLLPPPSASGDVVGEEAQDLQITEATPESVPKNNDSRRVELPPPISPKAGKITKLSSTNGEIASSKASSKVPEHEEQATESNGSKDKTLKKPDKIVPCPRCKSLDTKFCYFNNYNVNQPRHFCKNCQRYWTAGGTMRNVPVGAGRRKTKSSGPHYRHLTTSDPPSSNHSGTVLTFGSDSESVASVLNPAEGRHRNSDDRPGLLENSNEDSPRVVPGITPTPYFNGTPWPYPAFCNSSFPIPFYHGPAYWAVPWLSPLAASSPRSDLDRPKLVGHLKEGDDGPKERKEERCIWVPKTLRIDNPEEAAKSSIWAMLGVKIDKGEENNHRSEASKVLHANPAALSRSVNFHEIS